MDIRVSLKQALKSLGFQGGNKHDTELNQWINHEKEVLADIAKQYGIEWEQKGTHEEHLDVYNFKKKERKKEVQALEQEKEYLTAENEGLTAQIAESKADIQLLKEDKEQAVRDKEAAEKRAEKAEIELKSLEERREQLQPIIDNVSKEIKEYGTVKTLLPEAGALERAGTYRDKIGIVCDADFDRTDSAQAVKHCSQKSDNDCNNRFFGIHGYWQIDFGSTLAHGYCRWRIVKHWIIFYLSGSGYTVNKE